MSIPQKISELPEWEIALREVASLFPADAPQLTHARLSKRQLLELSAIAFICGMFYQRDETRKSIQ